MRQFSNITRREFVAVAGAAAATRLAGAQDALGGSRRGAETDLAGFEAFLPKDYGSKIAVLDDGRVLAIVGGSALAVSEDDGSTWSAPVPMLQGGQSLKGSIMVSPLRDGQLGLLYAGPRPESATTHQPYLFSTSADGGRNWNTGVPLDLPGPRSAESGSHLQVPFGDLRQLSNGRLLVPMYWQFNGLHEESRRAVATGKLNGRRVTLEGHGHRPQMGGCYVYYSDDLGKTWRRSVGSIMVWPLPSEDRMGGFAGTYEPVVVELDDGRVMMLMRTKVGRLFQCFSGDGGKNWSAAGPTPLATGDVPCDLERLPSTGDLVVVWNQTSADEIRRGYYRSRLSAALSKDEGESWTNFRTVDCSPGLPEIGRVEPPPVKHIRVNEDAGQLAEGFVMYHYPRVVCTSEKALLVYSADHFPNGRRVHEKKLKVLPVEWFYAE